MSGHKTAKFGNSGDNVTNSRNKGLLYSVCENLGNFYAIQILREIIFSNLELHKIK